MGTLLLGHAPELPHAKIREKKSIFARGCELKLHTAYGIVYMEVLL